MGSTSVGVQRMSKDFYRAFEEKHRGPREFIKSRLEVYLPFLAPLRNLVLSNKALDLGCGRGEWLELLGEHGYDAVGIDIDDGMLEACRERGLQVKTCDALSYLKELSADSLAIVSAFHVVEHISFDDLQILLAEAKRVLRPGGLLILETPNPENLAVGACHFYLDPTHLRPIPPELLSFTTEHADFYRSKILRLQETKSLITDQSPTLMSVLAGASPDYAVVAQKDGPLSAIEGLQIAFDQDYGVSLDTLAARFQNHLISIQAQAQLAHAESKAAYAEAEERLFSHIESLEARILNMMSSNSWRVTAPLRWFITQLRLVKSDGVISRLRALTKKTLNAFRRLLHRQTKPHSQTVENRGDLTPHARQIYAELQAMKTGHKKDK